MLFRSREILGEEETNSLILKVTKKMTKYTRDDALFAAVREEIGRRVAELSASK